MRSMIRHLSTIAMMLIATQVYAQNRSPLDQNSINAIKIEELTRKRAALIQQIEKEEAKRGREIADSTYIYMEMVNQRQDSICLELRSQLVAIELQIEEIKPPQANPVETILNQFNNLQQQN